MDRRFARVAVGALLSLLVAAPTFGQGAVSEVNGSVFDSSQALLPGVTVTLVEEATGITRTVVSNDRGRFVVPDLPSASYTVWVRGYGLVDSAKTTAKPGQHLTIAATPAPNEAAAAHYYPAIYWYSMLKIPAADQFGGKSSIPARLTQNAWISAMKNTGCIGCHQLGQQSTRTIPAALGTFASGARSRMLGMGAVTCIPRSVTLLSCSKGRLPGIISKVMTPSA